MAAEAEASPRTDRVEHRRCAGGRRSTSSGRSSSSKGVRRPRHTHARSARPLASRCSPAAAPKRSRRACEAERMAAELGLDAVRADALATIGTARGDMGDPRGDADLELAIELAEAASAPLALSRAINNSRSWAGTFDLQRSYALTDRNYETMQRLRPRRADLVGARPARRHVVRNGPVGRGARARRRCHRLRRGGHTPLLRRRLPSRARRDRICTRR